MARNTIRKTYSLPLQVDADLTYLAGRLGITRSALVGQMLTEPLADLRRLVEDIPEQPTEADVIRYRGASRGLIEERVENLRGALDDLFSH